MATVITGKENILAYRERVLLSGLKLETKGMKMSRGKSCYAIVKAEYGFKGSKQKVYDQLKEHLGA
jgi:hypothetical protein